ncbi:extensin-like [Triticum dicoccoides]|uniref:Uncharacterized protein n=1 Tax=Triticum aestivum TaxID=4565 RepID=A0A3B6LUC2_WHEAT|nr:extensin-like [Triticum dicoccoides]XP_044390797.1 extensin-like [Triticum aestivum]
MEMAKPPRPRGFKVGRRPTAASRKDHGGGGVRQPPRGPARAHLPPASPSSAAVPAAGLLPRASVPSHTAPEPSLLPPAPAPSRTAPAPGVPPPEWVPWYMAPASWDMTHPPRLPSQATPPAPDLLPLASAPSHTTPALGLLLPSTAPPEPCKYYTGMLLGPRVYARDLSPPAAPATSVATAAFLPPPPTANPLLVCKESMEGCKYVNMEMSDEETEEEYESRKKAEWCCGA